MNRDYEALRPPRSQATVALEVGRITIDLPAQGVRTPGDWGCLIAVVLSVLGLGGNILALEVLLVIGQISPEPERLGGKMVVILLLLASGVVGAGWAFVGKATRRGRITIAKGELTIESANLASRDIRGWPLKEVLAVGQGRGLWVSARDGKHVCFWERRKDELAWVADVLQAELRVTDQTPPEKGEIAVRFDQLNAKGAPGLLRVEPERMIVEHGFAVGLGFCVQPRRRRHPLQFLNLTGSPVVWVVPEDLTCRLLEGGSCLETRATGKRERLVVWSDDPEALPRVVAMFWGGDPEGV